MTKNKNNRKNKNNYFKKEQDLHSKIKHYIGDHIQAPSFLKDNKYIQQGYRINFYSLKTIFKSLFMVHNELINIWTHFLGAIILIILIFCLLTNNTNVDFHSWK